jgi:hypothetical protein
MRIGELVLIFLCSCLCFVLLTAALHLLLETRMEFFKILHLRLFILIHFIPSDTRPFIVGQLDIVFPRISSLPKWCFLVRFFD